MKIFLFIRSLAFYVSLAASLIVMTVVLIATMPFADIEWRYNSVCRRWARYILWSLKFFCGVTLRNEGMENMPKDEPVVVLCKHQSAWDPFWLGAYLERPACFLYKRSLHLIPFLGWALWSMDMLAVDRQNGRSAFEDFMQKGPKFIKKGWWICLFPEGTRVPIGHRVKYKTGGARFACSQSIPVLPIAHNAGVVWPKNSFIKYPGEVIVRVGPVIETAGRDPRDVTEDASEWIEAQVEQMCGPAAKAE